MAILLVAAFLPALGVADQPDRSPIAPTSTGETEVIGADPAPFPKSHSHAAIARWTRANTHIPLQDLAVVSNDFLFAMREQSRSTTSDGVVAELDIHEEIISPAFAKQAHARSVQMTMSVLYANRRLRINSLTFYPGVDLSGSPEAVSPRSGWFQASEGDFAAELLRAAGDPNYRRPFAGLGAAQAGVHSDAAPSSRQPNALGPDKTRPLSAPVAAASTRPHSVQLGAFSTLPNAESALANANSIIQKYDGVRPIITPRKTGDKMLYFVQISNFQSSEAATMFCQKLQKMRLDCLKLN